MLKRRDFLKASLMSCEAFVANGVLGSHLARAVYADDLSLAGPVVTTSLGKLRGAFANGAYSFKGVHYGASTAGPVRFLPPVPPKPWSGLRDALHLGPPAPQDRSWASGGSSDIHVPDLTGPGPISEDCLVLNIWTSGLSGRSTRPVMVWLHGGDYTIGSSGAPMYDGAHLAAKHNVVVVGVNHRLNVFGYLYLGIIGGEKYADSGNVGMLDIVLALRWVRDNIAQFGGDPGNVTIFGQSGGGAKVSTLMAMPSAKGLFHKAIVESGSQLRANSREEADATARKFLAHVGIAPARLTDLLQMPMQSIISGLHSMTDPDPNDALGPVVDGRSLPRHPFDPDAPAITASVPMMIGTNATETTNLLGHSDPRLFSLSEADMRARLKVLLGTSDNATVDDLIKACREDLPNASPSDIYFAVSTDEMMRMDAITQAERKAAQKAAPAYMYLFAWRTPVLGGKLKSPHGIEIPFVFGNLAEARARIGTGPDLQPLAEKVSGVWAAFARTGNPSYPGIPQWPIYTRSDRATMLLADECRVVNDPGKEERLALARRA